MRSSSTGCGTGASTLCSAIRSLMRSTATDQAICSTIRSDTRSSEIALTTSRPWIDNTGAPTISATSRARKSSRRANSTDRKDKALFTLRHHRECITIQHTSHSHSHSHPIPIPIPIPIPGVAGITSGEGRRGCHLSGLHCDGKRASGDIR